MPPQGGSSCSISPRCRSRFSGFLGEYQLSSDGDEAPFRLETAGVSAIDVRLGDRVDRAG